MKKSKFLNLRLDEETYNYIQTLSDAYDLSMSYTCRKLIEIAVELHREGVIEFPKMQVNYQVIVNKFLNQQEILNKLLESIKKKTE